MSKRSDAELSIYFGRNKLKHTIRICRTATGSALTITSVGNPDKLLLEYSSRTINEQLYSLRLPFEMIIAVTSRPANNVDIKWRTCVEEGLSDFQVAISIIEDPGGKGLRFFRAMSRHADGLWTHVHGNVVSEDLRAFAEFVLNHVYIQKS